MTKKDQKYFPKPYTTNWSSHNSCAAAYADTCNDDEIPIIIMNNEG